jgi:hypothetical protein
MKTTAFLMCSILTAFSQPITPIAPVIEEGTNEPVTYPATVTWNPVTNALRYVVESSNATNLTVATNIIVPFIAGTNRVAVYAADNTRTSPPAIWERSYAPGVIALERMQYRVDNSWIDDAAVKRLTNPPSAIFRIKQERYDTLIEQ